MRTIHRTRLLAPLAVSLVGLAACGGSSTKSTPASHVATSSTAAGTTAGSGAATATATTPARGAPSGATRAAGASAPSIVTVTSDGLSASMHPQSHHPVVERPWPISFTVTSAGRPERASVSYEYLLGGQVVARRDRYSFDGHFADVFKWPAEAVGYPLTFRAVIQAAGTVIDLDYPIQVVR